MEEKRISIFTSLGAKLFYYMTGLVLITVIGNSYQNFKVFSKYLSEQAAASIISRAETTTTQIESQINMWKSQVAVVVPTFVGDKITYSSALERFIDSNSDFLAIGVYQASSGDSRDIKALSEARSKRNSDARFEDKIPASTTDKMLIEARKILKKQIKTLKKSGKNTFVASLAKQSKLPLMLLATRFDTSGGSEVLWSLLICWQSPLIKVLPKTTFVDSAIVDGDGRVFAANSMKQMIQKSLFSSEDIYKEIQSGQRLSNFVPEYKSASGRRVIGGYARLSEYGLATVIEEDIENAYEEMNKNQYRTLLWAGLFVLISIMFSYLGASGVTKNLREVVIATKQIAAGKFDHVISIKSRDEISVLANSVNVMSSEIVNLMRDNINKVEFEKELTTAKLVQSTFFPKRGFQSDSFLVSGFYQPATQCGGDLWGHYEIAEDVHLLYIADAMGHGAPAALVTAIAYSVGTTIANLASTGKQPFSGPAEYLTQINRVIYDAIGGSFSMTFFCAIIDMKVGKMTYANAGHNFPFLMPASAEDSRRSPASRKKAEKTPTPISIMLMGNPLGIHDSPSIQEKELEIRAGDKFFLFTDGLIECGSADGTILGRKKLANHLTELASLSYHDLKDEILSRAFTLFAGNPLNDDVTVVVAEIPKSWKPATNPQPAVQEAVQEPSPPVLVPNPLQQPESPESAESADKAKKRPYKIRFPRAG